LTVKIESRITGSGPNYAVLADDSLIAGTRDRISGYKPSMRATPQVEALAVSAGQPFASFITGRSGNWTVSFAVDRQHASADAALAFLQAHPTAFAIAAAFDLKITVGANVVYFPSTAITQLDPDEHSDQHTNIRYAFIGSTYTDSEPA
jgi:hypothetical protein